MSLELLMYLYRIEGGEGLESTMAKGSGKNWREKMKKIRAIWMVLGILTLAAIVSGCQNTSKEAVLGQSGVSGEPDSGEKTDKGEEEDEKDNTDKTGEEGEPDLSEPEESYIVTEEAAIMGMAADILADMTVEEKVGQLFMVNLELLDNSEGNYYEHTKITKEMKKNLEKYHVGGVIFFARNISTTDQTKKLIKKLQNNSKIPLFISVDEEGGEVARIGNNDNMRTTKFPTMEEVGTLNNKEYAYYIGSTIGKEIKELGFNLDFAPVADVKTNEFNTEIGSRSFGSDPEVVSDMVVQVVKGLQDAGVSATLKHFPGHGDASLDSHEGAVDVENDINRLRQVELVPFKAGIKAGADLIMVSHISVSRVTGTTEPASLSSLVMKDMLRTEMGFDGVIITDAMDMKAITDYCDAGEAAVACILSGADICLMPEDLDEAYYAVLEAVENGTISEKRLNESVTRILELKIKRGLILSDTDLLQTDEILSSMEEKSTLAEEAEMLPEEEKTARESKTSKESKISEEGKRVD